MNYKEKLQSAFKQKFNSNPDIIVQAPGRVNLIGEHTDYNDGFVFPVAIDRHIAIAARKRDDPKVFLHSLDFDNTVSFSLDAIERSNGDDAWSNYPKGVAHFLQETGYSIAGCEAVITGDIPIAAGLSSSAAMEVASALMFLTLSGLGMDKTQMALLCQKAENQFVGVNCGIMDQFISVMGKKNHALFLDCRSLDFELVPLNFDDIKIVVCNTKVKRELASSEYNKRRAECERGVEILQRWRPNKPLGGKVAASRGAGKASPLAAGFIGVSEGKGDITALRDVSSEDFRKYEEGMPKLTQRRCGYVIKENERVLASVDALKAGNLAKFGALMQASHLGLRDEYEVSSNELDAMVDIALNVEGVVGARMTGAGFGGCTVNLVKDDAVEELTRAVESEYPRRTGIQPDIYVCSAEDGANVKSY